MGRCFGRALVGEIVAVGAEVGDVVAVTVTIGLSVGVAVGGKFAPARRTNTAVVRGGTLKTPVAALNVACRSTGSLDTA